MVQTLKLFLVTIHTKACLLWDHPLTFPRLLLMHIHRCVYLVVSLPTLVTEPVGLRAVENCNWLLAGPTGVSAWLTTIAGLVAVVSNGAGRVTIVPLIHGVVTDMGFLHVVADTMMPPSVLSWSIDHETVVVVLADVLIADMTVLCCLPMTPVIIFTCW